MFQSKLAKPNITHFTQEEELAFGKGFYFKDKKYVPHTGLHPHETALQRLLLHQRVVITAIACILLLAFIINWHGTLVFLILCLTLLYFSDLLFNLFLIYRSFNQSPEIVVGEAEFQEIPDSAWPTYTVFCPLYKEWEVLPQFVTAMSKLDYPKDKLTVMLLLEEDDTQTIEYARAMNLPTYFEIVVVPHSMPKTKPKACNYGLTKTQSEYCVIYDAEDVPDPLQLKKAVVAFHKVPANTICIQAKLNFYNPHQNLLTRLFTAEYSLWFDLVLTGLQTINAPIPLGGTSNHFRTKDLHHLKGWDAFNVTEDCDLGLRLVKHGYQTAIIDSQTLEEANSDVKNWFYQRSRWIKGYIQTYFVHMRKAKTFIQRWNLFQLVTFQLLVGGKVLSMFINPLMWFITLTYFIFRSQFGPFIESLYPSSVLYMAFFSFVFGNFLYLYYYMIGCYKRGHDDLIKYVFFVPIYWLGMSVAAWYAVYKLITAPHHWFKTQHGLHLQNKKVVAQAEANIGQGFVDAAIAGPKTI